MNTDYSNWWLITKQNYCTLGKNKHFLSIPLGGAAIQYKTTITIARIMLQSRVPLRGLCIPVTFLACSSFQSIPQKYVKGIPCLTGSPVVAEHGSTGYSYHCVSVCWRSKPAAQGKWKELRISTLAKWKGWDRGFLYLRYAASQIRSTSGFIFSAPSFRSRCDHSTGTHLSTTHFYLFECIYSSRATLHLPWQPKVQRNLLSNNYTN